MNHLNTTTRDYRDAWKIVLITGKDPDGFYTLSPELTVRYRRAELAEVRQGIRQQSERLLAAHKANAQELMAVIRRRLSRLLLLQRQLRTV